MRNIAYLHLIEARGSEIGLTDTLHADAPDNAELFRSICSGPLLSAAAYTPDSAALAIEQKHADAIAFGRLFTAKPDLVERIRANYPLNPADRATFHGKQNMVTRTTRRRGGCMSAMTDTDRSEIPEAEQASFASRLVGAWHLVNYIDEQSSRDDSYPFGHDPQGFLIYTPDGFVSAQLMKTGRPAFRSSDWHHGTPEVPSLWQWLYRLLRHL